MTQLTVEARIFLRMTDIRYQIRDVWESVFEKPIPHTFVQIAQLRQSEAIHTGEDLVQPEFWKSNKEVSPISGIKKYHIDLNDRYPIRFVRESSIQSSIPHPFVQITQLWWKRPGKCYWVKGFHQSLWFKKTPYYEELGRPGEQSRLQYSSGVKKYHIRGKHGRPSERLRPEYSSGDRYQNRVVRESYFKSSILHILVQIAKLRQIEAIHTEEDLVQPKLWKGHRRVSPTFGSRIYYVALDNRSLITVVQQNFIQTSIPHVFV